MKYKNDLVTVQYTLHLNHTHTHKTHMQNIQNDEWNGRRQSWDGVRKRHRPAAGAGYIYIYLMEL